MVAHYTSSRIQTDMYTAERTCHPTTTSTLTELVCGVRLKCMELCNLIYIHTLPKSLTTIEFEIAQWEIITAHTYIRICIMHNYMQIQIDSCLYTKACNKHTYISSYPSSLPLLVHTLSSSFTLHLPPSRRDWTSCNLPFPVATSKSLSGEALAAACAWDDRSRTHI